MRSMDAYNQQIDAYNSIYARGLGGSLTLAHGTSYASSHAREISSRSPRTDCSYEGFYVRMERTRRGCIAWDTGDDIATSDGKNKVLTK
jgi:hypothetical protein